MSRVDPPWPLQPTQRPGDAAQDGEGDDEDDPALGIVHEPIGELRIDEVDDERILKAVSQIKEEKLATPILVGSKKAISNNAKNSSI